MTQRKSAVLATERACRFMGAAPESLSCLILKTTALKETDLIVCALNSEGEQLRAVAHGARKPGSKFGGRLLAGNEVRVLIRPGKNLATLTEASLIFAPTKLSASLVGSTASAAIRALLAHISYEDLPEERIYRMSTKALRLMDGLLDVRKGNAISTDDLSGTYESCSENADSYDKHAISTKTQAERLLELIGLATLLKLVAQIGFCPDLSQLHELIAKKGNSAALYFEESEGRLISDEEAARIFSPTSFYQAETLLWAQFLIYSPFDELMTTNPNEETLSALKNFIFSWVEHCCQLQFKSFDFWRRLGKL